MGTISSVMRTQPWIFAAGLLSLDPALQPGRHGHDPRSVGAGPGLARALIVGAYPAVNGNFFLPTYGTVLATVSFDQTGTTRIGKYLLNHSFMLPGLVTTVTAAIVASILAQWIL